MAACRSVLLRPLADGPPSASATSSSSSGAGAQPRLPPAPPGRRRPRPTASAASSRTAPSSTHSSGCHSSSGAGDASAPSRGRRPVRDSSPLDWAGSSSLSGASEPGSSAPKRADRPWRARARRAASPAVRHAADAEPSLDRAALRRAPPPRRAVRSLRDAPGSSLRPRRRSSPWAERSRPRPSARPLPAPPAVRPFVGGRPRRRVRSVDQRSSGSRRSRRLGPDFRPARGGVRAVSRRGVSPERPRDDERRAGGLGITPAYLPGSGADAGGTLRGRSSADDLPLQEKSGGVLLSQAVSHQVPSAQEGLTSVFGMGTGVTPPLLPPKPVVSRARQRGDARPLSPP
jgi:hypothetical protein